MTAARLRAVEVPAFIRPKTNECVASRLALTPLVTLDNFERIVWPRADDVSFKCLPYQLSMVGDLPTMVATGNGESGFDSGEGA